MIGQSNLQNSNQKVRLSAVYLAVVMALIPLFNLNVGGRGLFLYLGAGIILTFFTLSRYTVLFGSRLIYLLFALYTFFTFIWSSSLGGEEMFQYFKTIFFVISISFVMFRIRELKYVYYLQIIMGIIIAIILATTSSTMVGYGQYVTDTERSILMVGGVQIDPNYASILLIPAACFFLKVLLSKSRKPIHIVLALIGLPLILFALLRSGSRGGLLAILVALIYYYIRSKGNIGKKIIILIIAVAFILIFLPNLISLLPDSVAKRFVLSGILATGGTGRTDLWLSLLNNLFSSPLAFIFGHGYNAALDYLGIASHNYFLDVLYNGGVVCLIILIVFYWKLFSASNRNGNIYAQAIFVGYLTMSLSVSVGNNMFFWTGIVFVMLLGENQEFEIGKETV